MVASSWSMTSPVWATRSRWVSRAPERADEVSASASSASFTAGSVVPNNVVE